MTYMDAIQYYCEQNNIEIETIENLFKALKQKVREEAEDYIFFQRQLKYLDYD